MRFTALSTMFRPLAARVPLFSHTSIRSFHSPYVVLRDSRLNAPLASPAVSSMNEKQNDHSAEPFLTHAGTRTYVVSEPDATSKHYQVPSGAYSTSAPYANSESSAQMSSTRTYTTTGNEGGTGESSADRFGSVPGELSSGTAQEQGLRNSDVTVQGGLANAWRTRR